MRDALVADLVHEQRLGDGVADVAQRVRASRTGPGTPAACGGAASNSSLPLSVAEVLAVDDDLAAGGVLELQQHLRHGGLARAGLADERHGGALGDLERHVVDRRERRRAAPRILKTLVRSSTTIAGGAVPRPRRLGARLGGRDQVDRVAAASTRRSAIDDSAAAMLARRLDATRGEARRRGDQPLRVRVLRVLQDLAATDRTRRSCPCTSRRAARRARRRGRGRA